MTLGEYKSICRAIDASQGEEVERLESYLGDRLADIEKLTPMSPLVVVSCCNFARDIISHSDMPTEARDMILAELHGIIMQARRRSPNVARAIRNLPRSTHARQAQGSEAHILQAIGRAASPFRDGAYSASKFRCRRAI